MKQRYVLYVLLFFISDPSHFPIFKPRAKIPEWGQKQGYHYMILSFWKHCLRVDGQIDGWTCGLVPACHVTKSSSIRGISLGFIDIYTHKLWDYTNGVSLLISELISCIFILCTINILKKHSIKHNIFWSMKSRKTFDFQRHAQN